MPDENDENNLPKREGLKLVLKVFGISIVILLAVVVIGFGLMVGFCALAYRKH